MTAELVAQSHPERALPQRYKDLSNKTILVTGAAGFIGGALFNRLAGYGLDVIGTVLYPNEMEAIRSQGHKSCVLDLAGDEPWDEILRDVDIVFNIAAVFQEVEQSKEVYDKVNHAGALKLAQTAARMGVERFVHCSTVGVLGDVREIPATERTPFHPMDVYHETKLAGELAVLEFGSKLPKDGMVVTVNRPAMVYGPGDLRMLKLFKSILSRKFVMIGSGKTLAHLGYIDDQVESFLLCAVAPREKVHLEVFNIASGEPITLNALASLVADCGGVRIPRFHIPVGPVWLAAFMCELIFRPTGVKPPLFRRRVGFFTHNRAFDISKARKHLGFEPQWGERAGIERTIEWYRTQGYLSEYHESIAVGT
jgi:nucleoside-diphosphate-sugar epimerase